MGSSVFLCRFDVDKVIDDSGIERMVLKAPGRIVMTNHLLTTGEPSVVNFISEVRRACYEETRMSDSC